MEAFISIFNWFIELNIFNAIFRGGVVEKDLQFILGFDIFSALLELSVGNGFPEVVNFLLKKLCIIIRDVYLVLGFDKRLLPVFDLMNDEILLLDSYFQLIFVALHLGNILVGLDDGSYFAKDLGVLFTVN